MPRPFHHILIIRFSSIGDIILTSPVVRCIKNQYPDAQLHYVTKPAFAPLLAANPYIDQIHVLEAGMLPLARKLSTFHFDFIVDLHHNQRSALLKTLLHRPGAHFPKYNWRKWKMVHYQSLASAVPHVVDRYFLASKPIGVTPDGKGLQHFVAKEDQVDVANIEGLPDKPFIAAGIGGSYATKVFPQTQWESLLPQLDAPVILLGGPADKDMADQLQQKFAGQVYHRIGEWTLQQSASIVQQSAAVIANDTGIMHMAAAFQKPLAVVWGSTVPEFGMGPYYGNEAPPLHKHFSVAGLSCRPCSKLGHAVCPKQHFRCMHNHSTREIAAFLNAV